MVSAAAQSLKTDLLKGTYTSGTLQTALAGDSDLRAALKEIMGSYGDAGSVLNDNTAAQAVTQSNQASQILIESNAGRLVLAESDLATYHLCQIGNDNLGRLFDPLYPGRLDYYLATKENYQRIQNQVNASGSKLKRFVSETTGQSGTGGTWTFTNSLHALSIALVGGGGGAWGGGGGGGAIKTYAYPLASLPANSRNWTRGSGGSGSSSGTASNGSASSFDDSGTPISANGGFGSNTGGGSAGTASGGDFSDPKYITDIEFETAVFQSRFVTISGGSGGSQGSSSTLRGNDGNSPLKKIYGEGAYTIINGTSFQGSTPGQFYGGGGGGGINFATAGPAGGASSAQVSGCGGAGATFNSSSSWLGGAGCAGLVVIYWVEA